MAVSMTFSYSHRLQRPIDGRQARLSCLESANSLSACRGTTCIFLQVASPRGQHYLGLSQHPVINTRWALYGGCPRENTWVVLAPEGWGHHPGLTTQILRIRS